MYIYAIKRNWELLFIFKLFIPLLPLNNFLHLILWMLLMLWKLQMLSAIITLMCCNFANSVIWSNPNKSCRFQRYIKFFLKNSFMVLCKSSFCSLNHFAFLLTFGIIFWNILGISKVFLYTRLLWLIPVYCVLFFYFEEIERTLQKDERKSFSLQSTKFLFQFYVLLRHY